MNIRNTAFAVAIVAVSVLFAPVYGPQIRATAASSTSEDLDKDMRTVANVFALVEKNYADPVSWVSYFTGGSAVHYISRGSYGSPQSLGCVELPLDAAKAAYLYLPYGTLVTVT